MTRRRGRPASQQLRNLFVSLIFAGVVYWIVASGMYVPIVNVLVGWYVDQITPFPGIATPAPS